VAEILQLHELFVEELQSEMAPLGLRLSLDEHELGKGTHVEWTNSSVGIIDAAIRAIATKFTAEVNPLHTSQIIPNIHRHPH
jgi:hypothetical protein